MYILNKWKYQYFRIIYINVSKKACYVEERKQQSGILE